MIPIERTNLLLFGERHSIQIIVKVAMAPTGREMALIVRRYWASNIG